MTPDAAENSTEQHVEANFVLELTPPGPVSDEVLDADSDDLLDAVQKYGADIALGPTLSLNLKERTIRLRFDVQASSDADIYRKAGSLMEIIHAHTGLTFQRSRSSTEASREEDPEAIPA